MAATITIDADTRGALDGLDRIDGRLDNVRRQLLRTEGAAQGLGAARITAFASSISAAGAAFDMVSRATDFARASLQAFFESSAEGKAIWEQIDMQFKSALGTIGELILGTSDVAEAGELVRDVMGDVTAVIRGVGSAMEPLISVMRTGLLGVLDAVAKMFGKAKDEADEYAAATARVTAELRELDQMTSTYEEALVAAIQGTDDYQVQLGTLEEVAGQVVDQVLANVDAQYALVQQGQITERQLQSNASTIDTVEAAYDDLRRQLIDAIVATGDLDRGFGAVAEEANALGSAIALVEVDNFRDELERLNVVLDGQSIPFMQTYGRIVADLRETIEGEAEAQEGANRANSRGADNADELRAAFSALSGAIGRATDDAQHFAAMGFETQAMTRRFIERNLERRIEIYNEARALEEEQQREINAIAERAAQERLAIQAEEHRQQQAADAAAQAARQSIFASVGGAMAGLIQAEGDAMTRVRKVLGQELVARGQAALAQAAIMAATLNPAAAGVAAAGLGAIALGKRFGAGGGGMGAGRGGGGGGRSATVTQNITFAGGAAGQDTRAIAAAIGRASRDGVREGMA